MIKRNSRVKEFYKLSRDERLVLLKAFANLSEQDLLLLKSSDDFKCDFSANIFEDLIENFVSAFPMPLSIAANFTVNGNDYLVPMVTEEASVIAAASNAAKLARNSGGFIAQASKSLMIGQLHILDLQDILQAKINLEKHKSEILELANLQDPVLVNLGGGASDFTLREINSKLDLNSKVESNSKSLGNVSVKNLLVGHLIVDVKDAMGANVINTMCEAIAPLIETVTDGKVLLKIVSNLAVNRIVRAQATWLKHDLGENLINNIIQANEIAKIDIFRAVTHNKGIMNGIDAVCMATGNDTRAIEAGAHGYAAINGFYKPLTEYYKDDQGNLVGVLELPMAVGTVGGATRNNPYAKLCLKILGVNTVSDLAQIIASVGLAQNFAAIKALVSEGIQKGHMRLHSRGKSLD